MLSLLDIQPDSHALELGFGPGVDIQRVSQVARQGVIVGIDHCEIMVQQARRRNAKAMQAG